MAKKRELTPKQSRFIDEYLISGNATDAARKAGYSLPERSGADNVRNRRIKKELNRRLAKIKAEKIADATEVMEILTKVARRQENDYVVTAKGETLTVPTSVSNVVRAAELLGKRYKFFDNSVDLNLTSEGVKLFRQAMNMDADKVEELYETKS